MTPEERAAKKAKIETAQTYKDRMTPKQKIEFLNTPYEEMPDHLRIGMTKRPQTFNFVRMNHPRIGSQNETFAARLIRYRDKYHLKPEQFCELCNEYAKKFDMPATKTSKAQRTRITMRDLNNYENFNVSPKIDKMMVISGATCMPIDYFAGYGPKYRRGRNELLDKVS